MGTPTLLDIAKHTNTSVSTVSRVLAGGASAQRISAQTRQRVLRVADQLGYRPNLLARSLRTRKTYTVGLMVSDIANPWFGQIASLLEQRLHRHGYSLMLCNSGEDAALEAEYLELLPRKGIDGLILVPVSRSRKAILDHLPAGLPLVVLDRSVPGVSASVGSDQVQMAAELCKTLQRDGVKSVAVVCGPSNIGTHRQRVEIVSEHFEVVARHEGPASRETGRQAFVKFLGHDPDAVICTNILLGQGYIDAIDSTDSRCVVACFDEMPLMHLLQLPIVCSVQDVNSLAERCVDMMLPLLQGSETAPKPVLLPGRIITNKAFQARRGAK